MRDAMMTFEKYLQSPKLSFFENGSCQNTLRILEISRIDRGYVESFNDRDFSGYKFIVHDLPYRDIGRLSKFKLVKLIWKKLIKLERELLWAKVWVKKLKELKVTKESSFNSK